MSTTIRAVAMTKARLASAALTSRTVTSQMRVMLPPP